MTIDANVDLTLSRFKLSFDESAGNSLAAYKVFRRIGDEWEPVRFVQRFAFEISVDNPIGKVTIEYAEVPGYDDDRGRLS